jgi:thymidylate synthase ThyX
MPGVNKRHIDTRKEIFMKVTEVARTAFGAKHSQEDALVFAGTQGAICYSSSSYAEIEAQSEETRIKRAENTLKRGHHSILGPYRITLVFEGIPKIAAMVLNSLGEYSTLERSARYTEFKPLTCEEGALYEKWRERFGKMIEAEYPAEVSSLGIHKDKLAMENARYMLSVFTPTTMSYETSIRQLGYIVRWFLSMATRIKNSGTKDPFTTRLAETLSETSEAIFNITGFELDDGKNRGVDFIAFDFPVGQGNGKTVYDIEKAGSANNSFGFGSFAYQAIYEASFAAVAQLQRHRTIKYNILCDTQGEQRYHVPALVIKNGAEEEWLKDISGLKEHTPQGTLVKTLERGTPETLVLKGLERLCGRVQLETAMLTKKLASEYARWARDHNSALYEYLRDALLDTSGMVLPRCSAGKYVCTDGCPFGARRGLDRLI